MYNNQPTVANTNNSTSRNTQNFKAEANSRFAHLKSILEKARKKKATTKQQKKKCQFEQSKTKLDI